ncbi:S8 family serine peptidase [Actinomadura atramentaria]|uniref:S8 family serine peptidase n=1 Tax=Actinomadura atramentaria TaxID=1990 RepID=UPI00037773C1|nr:S8 family serine peptidase [Actinomadura atramentaria]
MTRWLAATGASAVLALTTGIPAHAAPPANEEWWFAAWEVQQKVWPVSKGAGVTVAVIDSPVNTKLPDLQGALVPSPDDGKPQATDEDGENHGTQMVSLIASRGVTDRFFGLAPESKVLPLADDNYGRLLPESIRYAADHGAKVISMSIGAPGACPPDLQQAVHYALQKDVVLVAAAGNSGDKGNIPENPSNCAGVVAVGAVDSKKQAVAEAQHNEYVAVAAPGVYVGGISYSGKILYSRWGTSPATALTSATVALVRAKFPQMSGREVVQRIINTAKDAGPPGHDERTGAGVIIPAAALTANVPKSAPNPVYDRYDKWLASQPKSVQTSKPVTKSEATKDADKADQRTKILLAVGGGVVGLVIIVVILVAVLRGSKKTPPNGPSGPQGAPPAFGGPPQGQQPPPQGPPVQPHPGQGGQFPQQYGPGQPPQGPPAGPGRA